MVRLAACSSVVALTLLTAVQAEGRKCTSALEPAAQEGLRKTIEALRNPEQLEKDAAATPEARLALATARSTVGNDLKLERELIEQTGDVLEDLVCEAEGDPQKLEKIVQDLAANPESLASKLSRSQQTAISDLARKADAARGSTPRP